MPTQSGDPSRRETLVRVLSDTLVDLLLRDQKRPSSEHVAETRSRREAPP